MKTFTRQQALDVPENFENNGQLFLVRCPLCRYENWIPSVASGSCSICGAIEEVKDE